MKTTTLILLLALGALVLPGTALAALCFSDGSHTYSLEFPATTALGDLQIVGTVIVPGPPPQSFPLAGTAAVFEGGEIRLGLTGTVLDATARPLFVHAQFFPPYTASATAFRLTLGETPAAVTLTGTTCPATLP